jgi:hypothetical protein
MPFDDTAYVNTFDLHRVFDFVRISLYYPLCNEYTNMDVSMLFRVRIHQLLLVTDCFHR